MDYQKNKWYNFGDVNHREEGGIFVKRVIPHKNYSNDGDTIDIVRIDNTIIENKKVYMIYSREDSVSDLQDMWKRYKEGEKISVASTCDWERLKGITDQDYIIFQIAIDMIMYYGGDSETISGTNYWELLRQNGIYPSSIK